MELVVLGGHQMMGQAIGGVLAEVAGLDVLGVCSSSREACALIRQHPPRLLVLDVEIEGDLYRDAVDLLRALEPNAELLFITAHAAGLSLPADWAPITVAVVDKAEAWDALLRVLADWWCHCPDHLREVLPGCERQLNAIDQLSPRERRLLLQLGTGQLNKQIANRLQLSQATVESYRKSVAAKLGVSGSELVRLAVLYRCWRWDQRTHLCPAEN